MVSGMQDLEARSCTKPLATLCEVSQQEGGLDPNLTVGKGLSTRHKKHKCMRLLRVSPNMNLREDIMMERVQELEDKVVFMRAKGRKLNAKNLKDWFVVAIGPYVQEDLGLSRRSGTWNLPQLCLRIRILFLMLAVNAWMLFPFKFIDNDL